MGATISLSSDSLAELKKEFENTIRTCPLSPNSDLVIRDNVKKRFHRYKIVLKLDEKEPKIKLEPASTKEAVDSATACAISVHSIYNKEKGQKRFEGCLHFG